MNHNRTASRHYDSISALTTLALVAIGLLMVASSSSVISLKHFGNSYHYVIHQGVAIGIGLVAAAVVLRLPTIAWEKSAMLLLLVGVALLVLVLIPGIGRMVNGSRRWIGFGPFGGQVSEFAKLFLFVYLASFISRYREALCADFMTFMKPLVVVGVFALLLLLEPDFGTACVILLTTMGLLFLAGAPLRWFLMMGLLGGAGLAALAFLAPYRALRLTSFLDPWAVQFDSGYQLTQSLIAFGRGGLTGVGLGDSVQKLFYLPEAHTDFLFAVTAEELGLLGVSVMLGLYSFLVYRLLHTGYRAVQGQRVFQGFLAYAIGIWMGIQVLINIGVNVGVLPTKGLTLPLMSYGGSSIIMSLVAVALVLRVSHELD